MKRKFRITAKPAFYAYLFAVCVFSSTETCIAVTAALVFHELCHYAVAKCMNEPIQQIELTPFGGIMTYQPGKSSSKGLKGVMLSIAGPVGNYMMILLIAQSAASQHIGIGMKRQLINANLSMMLINLIPVLPLDGGNALFSLGFYLFEVEKLTAVLCASGVAAGAGCILLGIYGMIKMRIVNLSLMLVGGYLIVCAKKTRTGILMENILVVTHERLSSRRDIERVTLFGVSRDMPVYRLIKPIAGVQSAVFMYKEQDGRIRLISERSVCEAILRTPDRLLGDVASIYEET